MVYKYNKYNKYKRKYYKKNKLSKGNIFGNKSAVNQAKQIYSLNKKIDYLQRINAPEIKTFTTNVLTWINDGDSNIVNEYHTNFGLYETKLVNNPGYVDNAIDMQGELLRVHSLKLYGSFTLSPNRSVTYTDGVTGLLMDVTSPQTAYIRIIIGKIRFGGGRVPGRITQDGSVIGTSNAYKNMTPIIGPLISGIGQQIQIIKQKVIKVTNKDPFKTFSINFSNKQVGNFKKLSNWPTSYGMNEIMVYIQYLNPASIQKEDGGNYTIISPGCVFNMNCKIAYVDDC